MWKSFSPRSKKASLSRRSTSPASISASESSHSKSPSPSSTGSKLPMGKNGKGNVVASTTKQETLHARLEACRQRKQLAKQEKKENRNKTMSLLQKVLDGDKLDGELFGETLRKRSDTRTNILGFVQKLHGEIDAEASQELAEAEAEEARILAKISRLSQRIHSQNAS